MQLEAASKYVGDVMLYHDIEEYVSNKNLQGFYSRGRLLKARLAITLD